MSRGAGAAAVLVLGASVVVAAMAASPATADVTVVGGGAFGHYTKVGLFGGPQSAVGPLPDVRLPPGGSETPLTSYEEAGSAVYGPAKIFGGVWPPDVDVAPPSGPITVSTRGTTGPRGSVTSSVDIVLRTPRDPRSPGGWGPLPPTQGDELHATCTATEGGVSGSTRLVNAVMSKATTPGGEPLDEERIPDNPPVNYTREGVLTNVGDRYRIVYNEQVVEPGGGAITVNAVHMYLLGPIAVGESIVGQVRCSVRGDAFPNTPPSVAQPAQAPPPTQPSTTTAGGPPTAAAPPVPAPDDGAGSGGSPVPIAIAGAVVVAAGTAFAVRRRSVARGDGSHDP
ncbi:MAG TPA: hypothetical protein VM390_01410 [Acidimicrobiales bacterium]|jgi:hypothetical protein|nr:hypothetical protein [Acidimicrobiales bacterium]